MKLHFENQKAIDESAAIRKQFPDMGARREVQRLVAEQERWLRRLKLKHRLTNRELKKHCTVSTWEQWDAETGRVTARHQFTIDWTRWMKLKRWLRRKLKGENDGRKEEETENC